MQPADNGQQDVSPTEREDIKFDRQQGLKLLVELGPLVTFFLVNWQAGKFLSEP